MKRITRLLLTIVAGAAFTSFALAQDAAAPFRRSSPTPAEASPTPQPSATPEEEPPRRAQPAATPAPPVTATASPEQVRAPQPERPQQQEKAAAASAATPAKRVIQEPPVRAVEPRSPSARRQAISRQREEDEEEERIVPHSPRSAAALDYWDEDPSSAVKALEKRWQKAIVNKDIETIDELLASDFVATSSTGDVGSKSTLLRLVRRDKNEYKSADARSMSVRMLGPRVAVVTGVATESGTTPNGKTFKNSRRFTDTWMLRNGKWQCVASQATELPNS